MMRLVDGKAGLRNERLDDVVVRLRMRMRSGAGGRLGVRVVGAKGRAVKMRDYDWPELTWK